MRWQALALAMLVAGCVATPDETPDAAAASADHAPPGLAAAIPRAPAIHRFAFETVAGPTEAMLAVPDEAEARTMLVVGKGLFTTLDDLQAFAEGFRAQGFLLLAVEGRGEPNTWKVQAMVEDTVAATLAVQQVHGVQRTVFWGISLGGQAGLVALAHAPPGTFTEVVDGAGYSSFANAWVQQPSLRALIEAEAGGTPDDVPDAYAQRSPLALLDGIAASGVRRIHIVHAAADGVVPVQESEDLFVALRAHGVPATFFTVVAGTGTLVCVTVEGCVAVLPVGPASHEVAWEAFMVDLLGERLRGDVEPSGAHRRVAVDGVTGVRVDVPAT